MYFKKRPSISIAPSGQEFISPNTYAIYQKNSTNISQMKNTTSHSVLNGDGKFIDDVFKDSETIRGKLEVSENQDFEDGTANGRSKSETSRYSQGNTTIQYRGSRHSTYVPSQSNRKKTALSESTDFLGVPSQGNQKKIELRESTDTLDVPSQGNIKMTAFSESTDTLGVPSQRNRKKKALSESTNFLSVPSQDNRKKTAMRESTDTLGVPSQGNIEMTAFSESTDTLGVPSQRNRKKKALSESTNFLSVPSQDNRKKSAMRESTDTPDAPSQGNQKKTALSESTNTLGVFSYPQQLPNQTFSRNGKGFGANAPCLPDYTLQPKTQEIVDKETRELVTSYVRKESETEYLDTFPEHDTIIAQRFPGKKFRSPILSWPSPRSPQLDDRKERSQSDLTDTIGALPDQQNVFAPCSPRRGSTFGLLQSFPQGMSPPESPLQETLGEPHQKSSSVSKSIQGPQMFQIHPKFNKEIIQNYCQEKELLMNGILPNENLEVIVFVVNKKQNQTGDGSDGFFFREFKAPLDESLKIETQVCSQGPLKSLKPFSQEVRSFSRDKFEPRLSESEQRKEINTENSALSNQYKVPKSKPAPMLFYKTKVNKERQKSSKDFVEQFDDLELFSVPSVEKDEKCEGHCNRSDKFAIEFQPIQNDNAMPPDLEKKQDEPYCQSTENNKSKNPNIFKRIRSRISRLQEQPEQHRPYGRSAIDGDVLAQRRNTARRTEVCDSLDEFMTKRTQARALLKRLGSEDCEEYIDLI